MERIGDKIKIEKQNNFIFDNKSYEYHLKNIVFYLGKESDKLIRDFAFQQKLKIRSTDLLIEKNYQNCCLNKVLIIVYQKNNWELGRMRVCCIIKLNSEINRITQQFLKPKKFKEEIYQSSYKRIRGSAGHIIFQAFLGINEKKYIQESQNIKEKSILRTINRWVAPCLLSEWDKAIKSFQENPNQEKIKEIIRLYSPLYKENQLLIDKMSEEIISYLKKLPEEWKNVKIRILPTHVGMADLVVGEKLIELKFIEKKLGWQKQYFEQLYHYYRSGCKLNPKEKKEIKILCVFSPVTGESKELTISEANKKWNLKKNYQNYFDLWEWKNATSAISATNNILANRVKGPNVEEAKRLIIQRRKILESKQAKI